MAARKKGLFITLEGPDGSGKSTQLKLLAKNLKRAGLSVIETREPGGEPLSEKIREILLAITTVKPSPEAELLLFLAARAQHVRDVIRPALAQNKIVICERFSDSTYAYQAGGRGLAGSFITATDKFATQGLKPDLTLMLMISSQVGLQRAFRAKQGHDRMEAEGAKFLSKVRRAYLTLAAREPKRIRIISADLAVEEVAQAVWDEVRRCLKRRSGVGHAV